MDFLSPAFKEQLTKFIGDVIEQKIDQISPRSEKRKQKLYESEYLTKKQACAFLGNISLSNLNNKLKEKKIKKYPFGSRILISKAELEKILSGN